MPPHKPSMRQKSPCNTGWIFHAGFDPAWITLPLPGPTVRLPHSATVAIGATGEADGHMPWNYGDEGAHQQPFTYQRILHWDDSFEDREVVLVFEGAMAGTKVWVNGHQVADHPDGYTPFEARLTEHLNEGENLLTVTIDGTENPDIPPFGGRIDYLTYAGIYRDVWLELRPAISLERMKIEIDNPMVEETIAALHVWVNNPQDLTVKARIEMILFDDRGRAREVGGFDLDERRGFTTLSLGHNLAHWSPAKPNLHRGLIQLHEDGALVDEMPISIGIRKAEFRADGFFLNDAPFKILGLNRHQSFAHAGYALGPEAQARDADIVKYELGCNLVRCSHYPQSKAFLDRCDEIGLLVFEEIPGWQHIGGESFKQQSLKNVEAMITRDWNHPSIIIWGVRINESPDDDAFYAQTNQLARALDPTRPTGGVRCITDSKLLEDVYTMNDFVLGEEHLPGVNRPRTALRDQREVTGLKQRVPYMVTEYGGHMYPTKIFDGEERQEEHVRRHLEVVNAAHGDPSIAGSIGWCMADYNTHADFGSGDRICYHGMMSMSRSPKFAAAVYASQGIDADVRAILEPVTHWSFGDRRVGGIFPLIILTNCDAITFQYGGDEPLTFYPARDAFPHLPNPPIVIEAADLPQDKLVAWGDTWKDGIITGFVNGRPVARRSYVAAPIPTRLEVKCAPLIRTQDAYHDRLIRCTARDQVGNRLPFFMDQLNLAVDGPAVLQTPQTVPLVGGVGGSYVRVLGDEPVTLTVSTASGTFAAQSIAIDV